MQYHIGTIAKLLGMSPEGLRLYERSGIIKAYRDPQHDYRTYDHLDITALIRARGYHYCGFTTKEIADLINSCDMEEVAEKYEGRTCQLEAEIQYKQMLLDYLNELKRMFRTAEQELWKISFKQRPAMYRFEFMRDGQLTLLPEQERMFRAWVKKAPLVYPSQSNNWEWLLEGKIQVTAALGLLEEDDRKLHLDTKYARYYPSCLCLYTIVKEQGNEFHPERCLAHLMDYVKQNRIEVVGNPIARTFLALNKRRDYTRYRQVWLPIYDSSNIP